MTAKTPAERQAAFRQRKAQAGETEVRGIFAHPDLHQQIKAQAVKTARQAGGKVKQYKVPSKFWDDHCDRCPCDGDPDTAMANEVSRSGSRVLIEGNEAQIECLRSDAKFYSDKWGPDECPPGLKASAAATVRALASD